MSGDRVRSTEIESALLRHARACRGHPRLSCRASTSKAWMAGTIPGSSPGTAMTALKWFNVTGNRSSLPFLVTSGFAFFGIRPLPPLPRLPAGKSSLAETLTSPRLRGEVGICALFAQIPGEGASPQAQTGRKGSRPSHKFRLAEKPPHPDPLPASGEREQWPAPRRNAEAVA
jgi:hypothetical protein